MKISNKALTALSVLASVIFVGGNIIPENMVIPVQGASEQDWNHDTFWYEPWGKSGVHKGIDIFSSEGQAVISATYGIVIFSGNIELGGNVVAVLGPKWRVHYYAHLKEIDASPGNLVSASDILGSVGVSGNARGKPPHLHYYLIFGDGTHRPRGGKRFSR